MDPWLVQSITSPPANTAQSKERGNASPVQMMKSQLPSTIGPFPVPVSQMSQRASSNYLTQYMQNNRSVQKKPQTVHMRNRRTKTTKLSSPANSGTASHAITTRARSKPKTIETVQTRHT